MKVDTRYGDWTLQAMAEKIARDLQVELKQRVMAVIEPQIDEAIQAVGEQLQTHIQTYHDLYRMRNVIHVIMENRSTPK